MTSSGFLPFDDDERRVRLPADHSADPSQGRLKAAPTPDQAARVRAVDPRFNVALEASAGTGKTRVLVDRYINLLRVGVDPANILAMTFTRKAAAEMRARIVETLRTAAARGEITPARWRELQDRLGDIAISTIDAFCLSLLREFPLEADLDPGFSVADDSDVPRLVDEALDRALRICRGVARDDERVALVFAQLGDRRARSGLAALLSRRLVARDILSRFLARGRHDLTVAGVASNAARRLLDLFAAMAPDADEEMREEGLRTFVMTGPADPAFMLFVRQLEQLEAAVASGASPDPRLVFALFGRAREYFLTRRGEPRSRLTHPRAAFASDAQWRRHRELVAEHAGALAAAWHSYRHDINVLVSGGVWRMFTIAEREYRRTLDAHAVLDFPDLLQRTLDLLRRMEEFARSRYRLEARYHHVLVDEFQDTSRAQWELVALLVESWGEGAGLAHAQPLPPSIFIVGDRKQSIYGFRDADVSVMGDAIRFLQSLRPDGDVRRSISRSFRSVPALLSFVNDVCEDIEKTSGRRDAFDYGADDRFPVPDDVATVADGSTPWTHETLGLVLEESLDRCARSVAGEIARLVESEATVRDITTGVRRAVRAGDVAILFRTRDSHRAFEDALERRGIPSYVYKGLGFFDSDEVRDVLALLGFLANPGSDLRVTAFLRSGFIRLSDEGLRRLAPRLADALTAAESPDLSRLDPLDARSLVLARAACRRWLHLVDRVSHSELLDLALSESAYAAELRGARARQARENLKKIRGLVRRAQNKGYTTLGRIVSHLDRLAVGDESNAAIDAVDAVNLMTVHAAKGLEFPVVFVVDLSRGTGSWRSPIRVAMAGEDEASVSVGDFQSSSDEDDPAQEREETKRLLYVALTRARDRLYLGSVLQDGHLQAGRGSLAEVMPATLLHQLGAATSAGRGLSTGAPPAVDDSKRAWRASSGQTHVFSIVSCPPDDENVTERRVQPPSLRAASPDSDFGRLISPSAQPGHSAGATAASPSRSSASFAFTHRATADRTVGERSERLLGTLVHRFIQRAGLTHEVDALTVQVSLRHLVRPDEQPSDGSLDDLLAQAATLYRNLSMRADVRALYETGDIYHEVPFTFVQDGSRSRGSIDCVIARHEPPGNVHALTILEFKTGQERPEHREQVAAYKLAMDAMFPGVPVSAVIVYPDALLVM